MMIDPKFARKVNAHPAQKLLRELLDDSTFYAPLTFEIAWVTDRFEEELSRGQMSEATTEIWECGDPNDRDILRKHYFNKLTDKGGTQVSAWLRVNLLRRLKESRLSAYLAILESCRYKPTQFIPVEI